MSLHALILTPYANAVEFGRWTASRMLVRGLDELEIRWTLHQPWNPLDARPFDVMVCWSYGYRINDFPVWARRFEDACGATGPPVVNSAQYCRTDHHFCLTRWAAAGVPCARAQRFTVLDEVGLDYPLILRIDGQHRGRDMYLAQERDEAREIVAAREVEGQRPLNLAIEYIDTRYRDGLYRKWRSYVIGGEVMPRLLNLASDWTVNLAAGIDGPQAVAENLQFCRGGEHDPELLVRAAGALGADVVALDYHRHEDGRYTFFEGNRNFLMAGDPGNETIDLSACGGRTYADLERDNDHLSRLLGRLVAERVAVSNAAS